MSETTAVQFDIEKVITVTVQSGAQKKTAQVRFGADEDWMTRNRHSVSTKRNIGRNKSIYDPDGSETADLELFRKLRVDSDGDSFDAFEASAAIAKLERITEIEVIRTGDGFEVRMTALGVSLLHTLRIPTQAQMVEYSRGSIRVIHQKQSQNFTVLLEPSAELYKKLVIRTEGYANGAPPVIHQAAVISEAISELNSVDDEPNFT